jgi:hypothetical protein
MNVRRFVLFLLVLHTKRCPRNSPQARAPGAEGRDRVRSNKKADVIALRKRANSATLAEFMLTTGWQPPTVRGFVSILGSKGGEKVESSRNGQRVQLLHRDIARRQTVSFQRHFGSRRDGVAAWRATVVSALHLSNQRASVFVRGLVAKATGRYPTVDARPSPSNPLLHRPFR